MAAAMASKKVMPISAPAPECPVCMEPMCAPIFQCKMGHSLCHNCTSNLLPPLCPICRQDMTQMRNWQLEELVGKAKVPCPNKPSGCVYVMTASELDDHLKECIFRTMDCPLGLVFGKCSWNGKLKEMMLHFQDRHPDQCNISSEADVEFNNITVNEDDRFVYLISMGKLLFILTMKIDTLQKMAYWAVQHIGSKKSAQQHIYEIHVTSQQDARRKVVFADHCFNEAMKTDDIFRFGKCAMLPLDALSHYIKGKKLAFRFFIKKAVFIPKNKNENKPEPNQFNKPGEGNHTNKPQGKGPKPGHKSKGPGQNKCNKPK